MATAVRHFENNHLRPRRCRSLGDGDSVGRIAGHRLIASPTSPPLYSPSGFPHDSVDMATNHHRLIATTMTTHSPERKPSAVVTRGETTWKPVTIQFADIPRMRHQRVGRTFPLSANDTGTRVAAPAAFPAPNQTWSGPMSLMWPERRSSDAAVCSGTAPSVSFGMPIGAECTQRSRSYPVNRAWWPGPSARVPWRCVANPVWAVRCSVRSSDRSSGTGVYARRTGIVDTLVRGRVFRSSLGRINQPCWK